MPHGVIPETKINLIDLFIGKVIYYYLACKCLKFGVPKVKGAPSYFHFCWNKAITLGTLGTSSTLGTSFY